MLGILSAILLLAILLSILVATFAAAAPALGVLLAVQDGSGVWIGRCFALHRVFALCRCCRLTIGRLFAGGGLFGRRRLLANRFPAVLLRRVLGLLALGRRLLAGRGRRLSSGSFLRRRGDFRLGLLILLVLLARLGLLAGLIVVGRRDLFGRRLLSLLLLITLLSARLLFPCGCCLFGRRLLGLLLLVTLLSARLLFLCGCCLFGRRLLGLLLLITLLPARLLFFGGLLALGRRPPNRPLPPRNSSRAGRS
ncbi:hypothetical protein, partial [Mesorhizobium sp. M7A.F.Ca.CA.001.14.1.1]|uniref:hypothetical protein n=1 Tax=Mesorhizobium sp. M7A.F.Ca.CA.001.14.1.1 TaxID=2496706 RepID=UPI001FE1F15A